MSEIASLLDNVSSVVEAGALDGSDTVRLRQQFPQATVHAFEPVPSAFADVCARVADDPMVHTYEIALAETSGTQTMYVSSNELGAPRPDSSSLLKPTGHLEEMPQIRFDTELSVSTMTLDDWMDQQGVSSIDLLWLDMQGMELSVLQASPRALATVRGVMLEVSRQELYAGMPLYPEVIAWMKESGFTVAIDRVSRVFGNAFFLRSSAT